MDKNEEVENFDAYSMTLIKGGKSSQGKDQQPINQQ